MAFSDFLTGRKKNREQKLAEAIQLEQRKVAFQQDIRQKAVIMQELIRDPRYAPYRTILEGAVSALSEELDSFNVKVTSAQAPVGDFAHGLMLGKLLGRKQALRELLTMPESIITLSEERDAPQGNGRKTESPQPQTAS